MNIILIVLAILIGVVVLLALFAPKIYRVSRQIVINIPKPVVFEYIRSLKNQNKWSVWSSMDPGVVNTYTGTDGQVGFISAWEGNKDVGQGEQEIMKVTDGSRIDLELRFIKPFKSTAQVYLSTTEVDATQTQVEWGMQGNSPFPMNLFLLFANMEKAIGKDFEKGLGNLKAILEQEDKA
ncbi:MAG TPA: polyketide cyclase [Bacteroidales bacterium]|nr:polyketide cyclase [Bacteroidales bacterium]